MILQLKNEVLVGNWDFNLNFKKKNYDITPICDNKGTSLNISFIKGLKLLFFFT